MNAEAPTARSATGITLVSMFKEWPREALAGLSERLPDANEPCHHRNGLLQWSDLSRKGALISALLERVPDRPRGGSGQVPVHGTLRGVSHEVVRRARRTLSKQALSILDLDRYRLKLSVIQELASFQPQAIYTMMGVNRIMRLTLDLSDQLNIPIVPHFLDDWPATQYGNTVLGPYLRRHMQRYIREILRRSPVRLVIGRQMADEYSRRYGGPFLPFMNSVESAAFAAPPSDRVARRKIRFVYVGGLHLNRWRSLRDVGVALLKLSEEGYDVQALIYTQERFREEAKHLNIPPVMSVVGSLPHAEIPAVLQDADILIHVESFDAASRFMTRYSISTKIPELMAAARPILAYGPHELSSIRYVAESGAGRAVCRRRQDDLTAVLRELVESSQLRRELGIRGRAVALQNHDAAAQRDHLRSLIAQSVHDWRRRSG